jgi:UDP-2,4-diacetamido-2,4,6-trideoxy-beta-L-altropyranose hydrolase
MGAIVCFRVDASRDIGSGHVMRCLALAGELRRQGAACHFICRAHPGHLGHRIEAEGHRLTLLPAPTPSSVDTTPRHAAWLGCDWQDDAQQTSAALDGQRVDWLIVDHYAIDARWESRLRACSRQLMVIDDLADREHACDLLVDQNLGREARDYLSLVADSTRLLVGPHFALLRPEFAAARQASLARQRSPIRRVTVAMGGVDKPDATSQVLVALRDGVPGAQFEVTVVMGENATWTAGVRTLAQAMPFPCTVLVGVSDMAGVLGECDLAIGAGGIMTWERCSLGLPSIVASTADNQLGPAHAAARAGVQWHVGPVAAPLFGQRLAAAVVLATADPDALACMAERAASTCDGVGAARVARRMLAGSVTLRKAEMTDGERLHRWRNHPATRRYFLDPAPVPIETHLAWMQAAISASDRVLLVAERDGEPVGSIRFDLSGAEAELSIYMDPVRVGQGLGTTVLDCAVRYAATGLPEGITRLLARVKPENAGSLAAFRAAGFKAEQELLVCVVPR